MEARDIEIRMRRNDEHIPFGILFRESIKRAVNANDADEEIYQTLYELRHEFRNEYILWNTKGVKPMGIDVRAETLKLDYVPSILGLAFEDMCIMFVRMYCLPKDYPEIWANYD